MRKLKRFIAACFAMNGMLASDTQDWEVKNKAGLCDCAFVYADLLLRSEAKR